jgi:uncharacterized membrane protein YbaN (DUF454 family)
LKGFIKLILIIIGSISVALGCLGIFLPILPTTPFLLLGAACYVRGSEKLYNWLINNKWFGTYIKNYREGRGIPIKVKLYAVSLLWISILYAVIFAISKLPLRIMLLLIAAGVTLHILRIKTMVKSEVKETEAGINEETKVV